jgi:hypothetical protein
VIVFFCKAENSIAGHAILMHLIGLMQLYHTLTMIITGRECTMEACMTLWALFKPAPDRATQQESFVKSG